MKEFFSTPADHWSDDVDEFHVHWTLPDLFERSFEDNTGRHFAHACLAFVRGHAADGGVDRGHDGRAYVWVHLPKGVRIDDVTDALERQYEREWAANRVPKLKVLVQDALRSRRVMADAVCRHQLRHGYHSTQLALRVLFCPGRGPRSGV